MLCRLQQLLPKTQQPMQTNTNSCIGCHKSCTAYRTVKTWLQLGRSICHQLQQVHAPAGCRNAACPARAETLLA